MTSSKKCLGQNFLTPFELIFLKMNILEINYKVLFAVWLSLKSGFISGWCHQNVMDTAEFNLLRWIYISMNQSKAVLSVWTTQRSIGLFCFANTCCHGQNSFWLVLACVYVEVKYKMKFAPLRNRHTYNTIRHSYLLVIFVRKSA